jgi:hypothetical protein
MVEKTIEECLMQEPDLSVGNILKLHTRAQLQKDDLYTFLKREMPEISTEDRLKYLSAVLNDYFEAYAIREDEEIRDGGYVIKRFMPKGARDA